MILYGKYTRDEIETSFLKFKQWHTDVIFMEAVT